MPKKSDKQLLIGEIIKCQAIAVLEEDDNDDYGFPSDLLDQRQIDHDTDSYDRMDT
ncbi:hypothetical protein DVH05_014631 [Phytophthora capsici]|nr:hypothetical protein DVH05_014631 [Phytophthora capsici]